jgi:hypothetical protein
LEIGHFGGSGRPPGPRRSLRKVGGFAPHLSEGSPRPPGPPRTQIWPNPSSGPLKSALPRPREGFSILNVDLVVVAAAVMPSFENKLYECALSTGDLVVPAVFKGPFCVLFLAPLPPGGPGPDCNFLTEAMIVGRVRPGSGG